MQNFPKKNFLAEPNQSSIQADKMLHSMVCAALVPHNFGPPAFNCVKSARISSFFGSHFLAVLIPDVGK